MNSFIQVTGRKVLHLSRLSSCGSYAKSDISSEGHLALHGRWPRSFQLLVSDPLEPGQQVHRYSPCVLEGSGCSAQTETYHIATCTFAISFSSLMGTSMSDCKHALVSRAQRIWQGRMDFRSPRSIRSSAAQKYRATLCQLERTEAPKLRTSILRIQSGWHENGAQRLTIV